MGLPFRMSSCHYNAGVANHRKVILFLVICVYNTERACCETVISGQFVTLSCSLPSSSETVKWIDGTDENSTTLSICEANKCFDDTEYVVLRFSTQINATYSWITVSSETHGTHIMACRQGDDVIQSFNLIFIDGNKIQAPRCDVFPYENETSKVKFECEKDTQGIEAELEIVGVGENIQESSDLVYSIVNYNHFINVSDVVCQMNILGINKSCRFPRGLRINEITGGDNAVFKIEANFDIDDLVIDWQLVKIDKTVVDTTSYSLWYGDEKRSMLFRNSISGHDIEGIIVKCEITRTDENQNASTVVGIGFISLKSHKTKHSDDAHGATESSNGNTIGKDNHDTIQEYKLYIMLACAFLGPLVISTLTAMWLIWKCGKKHQSTCVMSVKQVILVSTICRGFEISIFPRVMKYLAL